jgi:hypothetical protein
MKLYVLVRKDLSFIQQAVQAGHAIASYLREHKTLWDNGTLVFLGLKNERALDKWSSILKNESVNHSIFYEPDVDSNTSMAFTYDPSDNKPFKKKMDKDLSILRME